MEGGNQIGGRGEMIATTDEAAGANQIQIQDLKSSLIFIFIQLLMLMVQLEENTTESKSYSNSGLKPKGSIGKPWCSAKMSFVC